MREGRAGRLCAALPSAAEAAVNPPVLPAFSVLAMPDRYLRGARRRDHFRDFSDAGATTEERAAECHAQQVAYTLCMAFCEGKTPAEASRLADKVQKP